MPLRVWLWEESCEACSAARFLLLLLLLLFLLMLPRCEARQPSQGPSLHLQPFLGPGLRSCEDPNLL